MEYYAIQVRTRAEDRFIKLFESKLESKRPGNNTRLLFPRRRLAIRRGGKTTQELVAVFPGYLFIESESGIDPVLFWALRHTDGFFRFLLSNTNIKALEGKDLRMVMHFIACGPIAEKSRVTFGDDDRIIVAEGPLKGLEGCIVKVDKRKGRAKVKLDLYDDSFTIDLAFEVIQRP